MSDLPTPFGNKPISLRGNSAVASALAEAAGNDPRGGAPDGSEYMNFSGKRGVYELGKDKADVSEDELWVVNVASFEEGWVCWKGGNTQTKRFANIYNGTPIPTPDFSEFGPFTKEGDGWYQAKAFVLKSVDNDRQAYFSNNSKSGVSAIAGLQGEIADRLRAGQPYWPLVTLGKELFQAQGYKNHKPVFNIYGWLDDEAVTELAVNPEADVDELIDASVSRVGQVDAPAGATEQELEEEAADNAGAEIAEKKREQEPVSSRRRTTRGNGKRPAL